MATGLAPIASRTRWSVLCRYSTVHCTPVRARLFLLLVGDCKRVVIGQAFRRFCFIFYSLYRYPVPVEVPVPVFYCIYPTLSFSLFTHLALDFSISRSRITITSRLV